MVLGIVGLIAAAPLTAQQGTAPFASFPSQSTTDARFLTLGCPSTEAIDQRPRITLGVPARTTTFTLNVFDGDTGNFDVFSKRHWDAGNHPIKFSLYADPLRQGSMDPANLLGEWFSNSENPTTGSTWTASSAWMADNDWWSLEITPSVEAEAPSGNYFYNLVVESDGDCYPGEAMESNFKLAVSSPATMRLDHFSLVGEICQTVDDEALVHRGGKKSLVSSSAPVPVSYDGTFEMSFEVAEGATEVRSFDGDFDFGTDGLVANPSGISLDACTDDDDPDTAADYDGVPFVTHEATAEGAQGPGSPPDDNPMDELRRGEIGDPNGVGCVRYEVTDPLGNTYFDDNPSGSNEWEQFLIASSASPVASMADHVYGEATLPAGTWKVKIVGLDIGNPVLWDGAICATRPTREPLPGEDLDDVPTAPACPDLSAEVVTGTVWSDGGKVGRLDPADSGIAGVRVELVRPSDGAVLATTRTGDRTSPDWTACTAAARGTDLNGLVCFGVDELGGYEVRIAADNFAPGGPLYGKVSTTGGDSATLTLTLNATPHMGFGYQKKGGRK